MKYKVGDRAKIRSDLELYKVYGADVFISVMEVMMGKTVTIAEVRADKYKIEEFGCNWTDEMFEGLVKEDKTMYASELMELARKNPEKYEGKRYKVVSGAERLWANGSTSMMGHYDECVIVCGGLMSKGGYTLSCNKNTQIEEIKPIPQPVSFKEAAEVMDAGTNIRCVYNGTTKIYGGSRFTTLSGDEPVTVEEIIHGEWYIK